MAGELSHEIVGAVLSVLEEFLYAADVSYRKIIPMIVHPGDEGFQYIMEHNMSELGVRTKLYICEAFPEDIFAYIKLMENPEDMVL